MQEIENEEKQVQVTPVDPESQPLQLVSQTQIDENDDDPEIIFAKAVAEIDTQPLPRKSEPFTFGEVIEICLLVFVLCFSMFGIIWQCITYPHTLVVLYTKAKPANITATLDLPTRTLAPVMITRSATIPTTGHGHQDARAASGSLTFYNGLFTAQTVPIGTEFVASNGVKVATDATLTIPASDPTTTPPQLGYATVASSAVGAGAVGNIAAYAINGTFGNGISVKNTSPFQHGQDARDYTAVAKSDLSSLTITVNQTVTQAFTTAFPVRQGEEAIPTTCHTTATPTHQVGEEAQTVTLTVVKTCSAVAYNSQQLKRLATAAFTATRPGRQYQIIGQVLTSIVTVSPLTVHLTCAWAVVFTQNDEQLLAEKIAGDTPDQGRKVLEQIGVIAYASIPGTLPPAMYITFLVLVGK